jgi:hypothetical protein
MRLLYDERELNKDGFSVYQTRPPNFNDNPNATPDRNVTIIYGRPDWGKTSAPTNLFQRIPFAFEAVAIGPNSHIASAIIKVPGKSPYLLSVGSPVVGSFDPGAIISTSRVLPFSYRGAYLEVIFYPQMPGTLPSVRANYTRTINFSVPVYGLSSDPDFDPSDTKSVVVDGRKKVLLYADPKTTFNDALSLRFWIASPFNFDNPTSAQLTAFPVASIDDANVLAEAGTIIADVPPGSLLMTIITKVSSWDGSSYIVSLDD